MNSSTTLPSPRGARLFPRWFYVGLVLTGASLRLGAAEAAADPAKTHTLFMGADFAIEWEGTPRPVQEVRGSSFVIDAGGKRVVVASERTDLRVKMDKALKVTASSATVTDLKAERAYTPANDPARHVAQAIDRAADADAAMDLATDQLRQSQRMAGLAVLSATDPRSTPPPVDESSFAPQMDAVEAGARAQSSILTSIPDAVNRESIERAREDFDAFRLMFEVSSPRALANPYIVVATRYRENPERADTGRIWIYAQALPRVDTKPAKVRLFRGGFPPGYKLEDVQVHLYDQGNEIATNVSPKRVSLTLDEAMLFLTMEYCAAHKNEDLPPSVALAALPGEIRAKVAGSGEPLWVKISAEGRVTAVFGDEACARPVADSALASAVKEIRYRPALRQGKPVESVTRLKLGDLPQKT